MSNAATAEAAVGTHGSVPNTAPAYYLGRPARWWIATSSARRRRGCR